MAGTVQPRVAGQWSELVMGTSIEFMQDANPRDLPSIGRNVYAYMPVGLDSATNGRIGWWMTLDVLGIDAVFAVMKMEPAGDLATVTLDLASIEASAYDWDPVSEEGQRPVAPSPAAVVASVPTPQNLTLDPVLQGVSGDIHVVRARATAAAPPPDAYATYWTLRGQYRRTDVPDWTDMTSDGDAAVITDLLTDGQSYIVQVQYVGLGQESPWVSAGVISASVT